MNNAAVGMPCPVCKVALVMSERSGVEIDYCPQCRGVWLDRGELDKILERSAAEAGNAPSRQQSAPPSAPAYPSSGYGHSSQSQHHHGKRKRSFLEDLFD